jgi:hypothetical protein
MIHPEITMFKEVHKVELTIGLEVTISPDCQYYEPQYDAGMKYMVTGLCVDVDGLNISLSDSVHESQPMHNRFLQEVDGYRWGDIDPITKAVRSEDAPDFTDSARAALLWVLYHHQGGSSKVGQPIRFALGMGEYEHLSAQQIAEAKKWAAISAQESKG